MATAIGIDTEPLRDIELDMSLDGDPDFAEALPAHRLAEAIYASADAGGAVVEDPEGVCGPA